ncbi:SARP family transcriptional regulator [Amycolatopsis mediterranei S699]|uniref:SARP family transcriptional regulator n=2 Tax=Amycolatopsis mediterranei TaxID=33910 RepID=A0A0H3DFQ8_AMYMU|nr:SARP family transcriptional regulator [Amycolatopsis mediterranei U32]AEK46504.1 SARP family transcriptional regulator [Amycolatopsis mediterranei S699]AGT88363.1 SARP family transcriptional regulator [Amycolatopsis mediterranei RB]KDO04923.1 SARP family transcriptional regulator [Amycolatopsis mediterranei]AFO81235.1 SARP family transcriptional regulator [Amycolatopsis mediterranei S699]
MHVQVLGPVRVWQDGEELDLGPPGRRALLGVLALARGRALRRTALVDALWGDTPPPSATNIIQTHVKHLRRVLDPERHAYARSQRIPTVGDGYALRISPDQSDVDRFYRQVQAAEQERQAGRSDQTAAMLGEALGLWHGQPLADLPALVGHPTVLTLFEARRDAVLAYAEALLTTGRASEALPVVIEETATHPLDEALAAMLVRMYTASGQRDKGFAVYDLTRKLLAAELGVAPGPDLAEAHAMLVRETASTAPFASKRHLPAELPAKVSEVVDRARQQDERLAGQVVPARHRSGRRTNALARYEQLKQHLGIDPGPPLWQAHHHVLTAEPAVATPVGTERAPVPRQLPAPPRPFTGRVAELAELTAAMRAQAEPGGTVVISAIGGTGGIGKTWLALHWAHQHIDRFPDGQLFVNLRGFDPTGDPLTTQTAVRGFLAALSVEPSAIPAELDAQVGLYRSLLAGKRMLVVLDNARDTAQLAPLLPGSPSCAVLVTSRSRLSGLVTAHDAHPLTMDVLSESAARQLLQARLGAQRPAAEPGAMAELIACCGGFPLALSIVASQARAHPQFPLAALAAELRDASTRLGALDDTDQAVGVPAVLSWSYRALTPEGARTFGLIGLAPGPDIDLPATACLTGLPIDAARRVLRALDQVSLVHQHVPGRWRMHDLVRLYAADQARQDQPHADREAALRRVVAFYLHTADAADQLLDPHRQPIRLDPPPPGCLPYPLSDASAALAWFDTEHACLLAAHRAAISNGWHQTVWQLTCTLFTFHHRRGHRHDLLAVCRTGAVAAEHLPDPDIHVRAHQRLGRAYADLWRLEEAIDHLRRSLAIACQYHDHTNQAHAHHALARVWEQQGDNRLALEQATHALNLFRSLDDPVWHAATLNMVGWLSAQLGEYEQARRHCQAALTLQRHHQDPDGEAITLDSLGYIDHHTGRHRQAICHYQQALTLRRAIGHTYEVAKNLDAMGRPYTALGQPDQARAVLREALEWYRQLGRGEDAARVQQQLDDHFRDLTPS